MTHRATTSLSLPSGRGHSAAQPLWVRLIRLAFHLLYNQLAWTYDAVAWTVSLGQWRDWGRVALRYTRGPRVLDLGHGPGHLLADLAAAGYQAAGVDLSPAMGRMAGRNLARAGRPAPLGRGRAQALPFAAGSFDTVISTFPAEFIFQPATLAEIRRVLRPQGTFVMIPGAVLTSTGLPARLMEALFRLAGQRNDRPLPLPPIFNQLGLPARAEWVHLARSRVRVIIARREEL